MPQTVMKSKRRFAIRVALRALVDRLETIEPTEPNPEYTRGCLETAASIMQDAASWDTTISDLCQFLTPYVTHLTCFNRMNEQAFEDFYSRACLECQV